MKTPANPENAPLDKIPAGWRMVCNEEYGKMIPVRVWNEGRVKCSQASFSDSIKLMADCLLFTYITPDLPGNGQPWHAHKPGDPAPVGDEVNVDIVCRNGLVFSSQLSPEWKVTTRGDLDILFYRPHESAPMKTESPTTDRILAILIAAGHITEEQVEQARQLVKD